MWPKLSIQGIRANLVYIVFFYEAEEVIKATEVVEAVEDSDVNFNQIKGS